MFCYLNHGLLLVLSRSPEIVRQLFDLDTITEVAESRLVGVHGDIDDVEASFALCIKVHVFLLDRDSRRHHVPIILIDESDIDCGISCDVSAELEY